MNFLHSEVEVQNLQLSMEQISTSPSCNYAHSSGAAPSSDDVHVSPPTSVRSTGTGSSATGVSGGKSRPVARNKRRTSPYPAPSPPATVTPTAPVASASIISVNPLMHDDYNNQLATANMAPMDYRYDLQPSSSNQYLTSAMYSAYNANEVHLYSYGANGETHSDLYPSYYNNEGPVYPLRHYPAAHTMPEGTLLLL